MNLSSNLRVAGARNPSKKFLSSFLPTGTPMKRLERKEHGNYISQSLHSIQMSSNMDSVEGGVSSSNLNLKKTNVMTVNLA